MTSPQLTSHPVVNSWKYWLSFNSSHHFSPHMPPSWWLLASWAPLLSWPSVKLQVQVFPVPFQCLHTSMVVQVRVPSYPPYCFEQYPVRFGSGSYVTTRIFYHVFAVWQLLFLFSPHASPQFSVVFFIIVICAVLSDTTLVWWGKHSFLTVLSLVKVL